MKNKVMAISFERLAVLLLPTCLRSRLLVSLVTSFVSVFSQLLRILGTFRNDRLEDIEVNGQVCKLEALLNKKFDATQKRIKISDGRQVETQPYLIYKRPQYDDKPLPRGQEGLQSQIILNSRTANSDIFVDFYVLVPDGLLSDTDKQRLAIIVDTYKLQSKAYDIITTS